MATDNGWQFQDSNCDLLTKKFMISPCTMTFLRIRGRCWLVAGRERKKGLNQIVFLLNGIQSLLTGGDLGPLQTFWNGDNHSFHKMWQSISTLLASPETDKLPPESTLKELLRKALLTSLLRKSLKINLCNIFLFVFAAAAVVVASEEQ